MSAAKSLICKDCGLKLLSVKEAQSHNEVTGHANFEETTEAIRLQVCTECGKPCRSEAEQQLHTKYTGHSTFNETDDTPAMDTEAQMKEARTELLTDEQLLMQSKKGASSSKDPETDEGPSNELVPATVDEELLKEVMEMGFGRERSVRAIHHGNAVDTAGAVNWLMEHENDMDIDEPLMITQGEANKAKLTPEEQLKKAEELIRKSKEKREKEEKAAELQRERDRIKHGKEMQKLRQEEDSQSLKRNVEARQREKAEDAAYREKLRLRMEEDKKERRRKLGLPEELTEAEKAKEAERAEKARLAEAEKKKAFIPHVKPVSVIEKMRASLVSLKKAHAEQDAAFKTACSTMLKYIGNILANPAEEKYRTIKLSNAAFQQRVASLGGSIGFLQNCGFEAGNDVLTLPSSKSNMDVLNAAAVALNDALTNPFFGLL